MYSTGPDQHAGRRQLTRLVKTTLDSLQEFVETSAAGEPQAKD
jgi:hypothetical protein